LAQNPPQACARVLIGLGQDSITWQATPCTNFGGYVILGEENNSGTFIPLDTTTNLNYVNTNPSEVPWQYRIAMLCGGVLTSQSATVSNQRPITPDIRSVNIVNGIPVVNWDPSPTTAVIGYQVYKESPYGSTNYFPYPNANSIVSGTTFTDNTANDPLARYAILAVTDCNKGLLGIGSTIDGTTGPHTSMILQGNIDSCSQTIALKWNNYENWKEGTQRYEIWLSTNGNNSQLVDSVDNTTTRYTYTNAQDNDILVFQIRAIEKNKANFAFTNNLRINANVNRPMDFIYLTDLTVNLNNEIEIKWEWDTDVDFSTGNLNSGTTPDALSPRLTLPVIGAAQNAFTDNNILPEEEIYYYNIQSTDACGQVVTSNLGKSIRLKATPKKNFKNTVVWNTGTIQYGTVERYIVYKDGNKIATLPPTDTTYTDDLNTQEQQEVFNCYWVVAQIKLNLPDGRIYYTNSQSNQDCCTQGSNILMPNAIAVNGINNLFRPVIVFSNSIQSYSMQIFDRYGSLVFESQDLLDAWNGTKNGAPLQQGVYVYQVRYQAADGTWIEKKGSVMLIK
jgi:gliding motility-associated-like protein